MLILPLVTFGFGELTEVFFEVSSPDHRKDIDDGSTVTVDELVWYLPLSQRCRSLSQIPLSPLNSSMAMV